MNRKIKISKNHGENVAAVIKFLDINYIDKIIELEKNIYYDNSSFISRIINKRSLINNKIHLSKTFQKII